jgi:hypothetical protein
MLAIFWHPKDSYPSKKEQVPKKQILRLILINCNKGHHINNNHNIIKSNKSHLIKNMRDCLIDQENKYMIKTVQQIDSNKYFSRKIKI